MRNQSRDGDRSGSGGGGGGGRQCGLMTSFFFWRTSELFSRLANWSGSPVLAYRARRTHVKDGDGDDDESFSRMARVVRVVEKKKAAERDSAFLAGINQHIWNLDFYGTGFWKRRLMKLQKRAASFQPAKGLSQFWVFFLLLLLPPPEDR